jgi:maltose/moltooligosaccharide transporter
MSDEKKGFGKYLGLTFLIGFGFFTMGLMDPLYDTYVPVFLGKYVPSMALIGLIMTIDNIFAIFLIPIVSVWSDNTRTRIGRRMPFIVVALPLTAICFSILPYAAAASLGALIAIVFGLNLFKQSARGPVVALMPDSIPGEYRSEANGVINTMGGIATIVGTIGLAQLMNVDIALPLIGRTKDALPFLLAGLLVVFAAALVFAFVREKSRDAQAAEQKVRVAAALKAIAGEKDKSALFILLSLFFWFLGYQGVLPFIGKYSIDALGTSKGSAALAAGMVGIAYAIFAIPSGYVAHRIGRKRAIRSALLALAAITALLFFFGPISSALGLAGGARIGLFLAIMFVFGAFWVTVITNSFPMLWQMASWGTVGVYTGLYYTFSQAAAIVAPPITGAIIDLGGYPGIFLFASACMLAAFFLMGRVTRGEPSEQGA